MNVTAVGEHESEMTRLGNAVAAYRVAPRRHEARPASNGVAATRVRGRINQGP